MLEILCNTKDDCAEEICEQGVQAAESGDMGKALSLLSHAVVLNDKDYKTYEMIAQVKQFQFVSCRSIFSKIGPSELLSMRSRALRSSPIGVRDTSP